MSDLISREAALDALEWKWAGKAAMDAIKNLPSAQPDLQEYSVWFRIGETLVDVSKMHITAEEGIEKIRSYLVRMKKPERKAGKWIKHKDRTCWYCSECTADNYYAYTLDYDADEYKFQDNYCPNCGARMDEVER